MKFKDTEPAQVEVNMTPMIDIVFQLIAFFMVIINFEQIQANENVKLPRDEYAMPPKKARKEVQVISTGFMRDDKTGAILPGRKGGPFVWLPGVERTDIDSQDPRFPNMYLWEDRNDPAAGNDQEVFKKDLDRIKRTKERDEVLKETTILIRADGVAKGGIVTDLVSLCQEAGFEKFAFAATQKGAQDED